MYSPVAHAHGAGMNPIVIGKDDSHHSGDRSMWMIVAIVFIIFIIFAIIAFAFMFRENRGHNVGMDALAPILATTAAKGIGCGDQYGWDNHRDMSKYFYDQRLENDKYFYEQQKTTLLGFKDNEIQGMKNTAEINANITKLRDEIKEDKLREKDSKINYLETVIGIRGLNPYVNFTAPLNPAYV